MRDFEKKLSMLYSQYDLAIGKLKDLIAVTVKNPSNAMVGVMSKIGIPKKYGVPALEKFNAMHSSGFCSAHDIYYGSMIKERSVNQIQLIYKTHISPVLGNILICLISHNDVINLITTLAMFKFAAEEGVIARRSCFRR